MVKNFGGNRGKKIARKHVSTNNFNAKLRLSEDDDEVYACVTKMLGNGMCHVNCLDATGSAKQRLCIIRNKFRGRGKRDNQVAVGAYVLVGIRSWETSKSSALDKCDLVEVYNRSETDRLKSQVDKNWGVIHVNNVADGEGSGDLEETFVFQDENTELKEELEESMLTEHPTDANYLVDDDINIEDI